MFDGTVDMVKAEIAKAYEERDVRVGRCVVGSISVDDLCDLSSRTKRFLYPADDIQFEQLLRRYEAGGQENLGDYLCELGPQTKGFPCSEEDTKLRQLLLRRALSELYDSGELEQYLNDDENSVMSRVGAGDMVIPEDARYDTATLRKLCSAGLLVEGWGKFGRGFPVEGDLVCEPGLARYLPTGKWVPERSTFGEFVCSRPEYRRGMSDGSFRRLAAGIFNSIPHDGFYKVTERHVPIFVESLPASGALVRLASLQNPPVELASYCAECNELAGVVEGFPDIKPEKCGQGHETLFIIARGKREK